MRQEDIDKKIGMPDVDVEWAKFEREIINPKTVSRKSLYWGIGIAASIALVAGLFFLDHDVKAPQQTVAQQFPALVGEEKAAPSAVPSASQDSTVRPSRHDNTLHVAEVAHIIGSDYFGRLIFLTNHTDGERLTERLPIHVDSALQSWLRMKHYNREKVRLMSLKNMSFGIRCVPSSNEWVLFYDSIAHTLVYKEADKNIWHATRMAVYKEQKTDGELKTKLVPRKHPKRCRGIKVKEYSMTITDEQAKGLKAMWAEAVASANNKKFLQLEDTTYEFPLGELRVTTPKGVNPLITFTNKLAESVRTHNTISRDSLLENSTLEKCLTDMMEAMKPSSFTCNKQPLYQKNQNPNFADI